MKLFFIVFFCIYLESFCQKGEVFIDQDSRLDTLIKYRKELNFSKIEKSKYKIQIFSGKKQEAEEILTEFTLVYGWQAVLLYEMPNYKVRVGNFRSRLEADRKISQIKEVYPNAFIYGP